MPETMSKSAYGSYRRDRFGHGSPQAVSNWIKRGHLPPDCLTSDDQVIVAKADAALEARLQNSPPRSPAPAEPRQPPAPSRVATSVDDAERQEDLLELAVGQDLREPDSSKAEAGGYQVNRARREAANARKAEIELAVAEERFVELEPLVHKHNEVYRGVRDQLLALPTDLAPDLALLTDEVEIEALMRTRLEQLLEIIADGIHRPDRGDETAGSDSGRPEAGPQDASQ